MQLLTARLILREFTLDDCPAVLAYQNDPRYLRYYPWTSRTPDDVRAFVQRQIAGQYERPRIKFQLAIVERSGKQLIGNCGVRKQTFDAREADIGYELSPAYWGRGYATEAAHAIVQFGFEVLAVHRIWARCVPENYRSARVLEKLGLRLEGRLREREYYKGRWWDTLVYAILEEEWRQAMPPDVHM